VLAVLMRNRRPQQSNHLLWAGAASSNQWKFSLSLEPGGTFRDRGEQRASVTAIQSERPLVAAGDQERQTGVPGDPYLPEVYSALAWVSLQNLMPFGRPATTSLPQPLGTATPAP